jgi:sulfatase maturation enzyme AslB (radical SAM superfamily)
MLALTIETVQSPKQNRIKALYRIQEQELHALHHILKFLRTQHIFKQKRTFHAPLAEVLAQDAEKNITQTESMKMLENLTEKHAKGKIIKELEDTLQSKLCWICCCCKSFSVPIYQKQFAIAPKDLVS